MAILRGNTEVGDGPPAFLLRHLDLFCVPAVQTSRSWQTLLRGSSVCVTSGIMNFLSFLNGNFFIFLLLKCLFFLDRSLLFSFYLKLVFKSEGMVWRELAFSNSFDFIQIKNIFSKWKTSYNKNSFSIRHVRYNIIQTRN